MTTEPIFFEIPIYRTSIESYNSEMQLMRDKSYKNFPGIREGIYFENFRLLIEKNNFYPWKYNEVIGYLNLYVFGCQLRVDYWYVSNKRINKGIHKKKYEWYGKIWESEVDTTKSSNEIFEWILEQLECIENEKKFKKRHIDLQVFKVIGRFIDWPNLCLQLNSWKNPEFRDKYFKNELNIIS